MQQNMKDVEQRIQAACERSGRSREDIQVIAVTKYASLEETELALKLGHHHIGESRWQDARGKWTSLGSQATWHFIGHLQTNKVKDVIGRFAFIHSLDRPSLVKELQRRAEAAQIDVSCFIQVNVSGEQSKFGCSVEDVFKLADMISHCHNIKIEGLMTMAPYEASENDIRHVFRTLRQVRDEMNDRQVMGYDIPHLSMGMSGDFEIAIEEGATWIRLGSILLGR